MGIFESDLKLRYCLTSITDQLWASQTWVILSIPTCPAVTPMTHITGAQKEVAEWMNDSIYETPTNARV